MSILIYITIKWEKHSLIDAIVIKGTYLTLLPNYHKYYVQDEIKTVINMDYIVNPNIEVEKTLTVQLVSIYTNNGI